MEIQQQQQQINEIRQMLGGIMPSLSAFVKHLQGAGDSLSRLFGGGGDPAKKQAEKLASSGAMDKLDKGGAAAPLDAFTAALQKATAALHSLVASSSPPPTQTGVGAAPAQGGANNNNNNNNQFANVKADLPDVGGVAPAAGGGGGGGGLGAAAGAIAGMAGAAMAAAGAVQEVVGKLRGFVEAISPSTIEAFDAAMRDLNATIGTAFTGVFEQLTGAIRQAAAVILPVMEQLKPIVDQLVQAWIGQLIPVVKLLADTMVALMPLFRILVTLIEWTYAIMKPVIMLLQVAMMQLGFMFQILEFVLTPVTEGMKLLEGVMDSLQMVFDVLSIVIKTVIQTFMEFVKSLLPGMGTGDMLKTLKDATKKVIEAYIWFISTIYKALGLTALLANLAQNLKPKKGATAAVQNTSIKSIEQISKDMALAAAKASGTAGEQQSQEDMLAGLSKTVEDIASGKSTSQLGEFVSQCVTILGEIRDAVTNVQTSARFTGERTRAAWGAYSDPIGAARRAYTGGGQAQNEG